MISTPISRYTARWRPIAVVGLLLLVGGVDRCAARRAGAAAAQFQAASQRADSLQRVITVQRRAIAARDTALAAATRRLAVDDAALGGAIARAQAIAEAPPPAPTVPAADSGMAALVLTLEQELAQAKAALRDLATRATQYQLDARAATARASAAIAARNDATNQLEALRASMDAELTAATHLRRRWWDRLGVYGGYGLTATPGGDVHHGITVGLGVRLWP